MTSRRICGWNGQELWSLGGGGDGSERLESGQGAAQGGAGWPDGPEPGWISPPRFRIPEDFICTRMPAIFLWTQAVSVWTVFSAWTQALTASSLWTLAVISLGTQAITMISVWMQAFKATSVWTLAWLLRGKARRKREAKLPIPCCKLRSLQHCPGLAFERLEVEHYKGPRDLTHHQHLIRRDLSEQVLHDSVSN